MRRIIPVFVCLMAASAAAAAENCAALDTTQSGLDECYGRAFDAADKELNGVYRLITHRLDGSPDAAANLVAAQRAWIAFRDAECAFAASDVEGGSAQPMVDLQCREALTRKRVVDLKSYLNCDEGDLACPVPKP
ncbi:lysozyme inhibitor LprI family protein [Aureimonas leprariae]|uniref:DUF1311 domain-containing protein n=1 Tax=Plantimonas leprariae TaxID=2615207 RepID=A0A7V7PP73_9HYPH|nr:lysozyme inhibitor LprI family protein [Aureimonas leprariae]KAB0679766.1 DUF1311 domain-containing protein [Aureimonas leprariae]